MTPCWSGGFSLGISCSRCIFTSRNDQPILGRLRSSVILLAKSKKTTFQIHHIAPSADVTFRLTLPRTDNGFEVWLLFRSAFQNPESIPKWSQHPFIFLTGSPYQYPFTRRRAANCRKTSAPAATAFLTMRKWGETRVEGLGGSCGVFAVSMGK